MERDQSSDEDLSKHYESALSTECIIEEEESPPPSPSHPPQQTVSLSMLSGPKLYIPVSFHPCEYKPYVLSCLIDSGCQVNLARGSTIPSFYQEKTVDGGTAINGVPIQLQAKENLSVYFNGIHDTLTLYRMDDLSEDCVLGSNFLHQVNPYLVDHRKGTFTCIMKNKKGCFTLDLQIYPKMQDISAPSCTDP